MRQTVLLLLAFVILCAASGCNRAQGDENDANAPPKIPEGAWAPVTLEDGTQAVFDDCISGGSECWGRIIEPEERLYRFLYYLQDGKARQVKTADGKPFLQMGWMWRVAERILLTPYQPEGQRNAAPDVYMLTGDTVRLFEMPDNEMFRSNMAQRQVRGGKHNFLLCGSGRDSACYRFADEKLTRVPLLQQPGFSIAAAEGDRLLAAGTFGRWLYDDGKWAELFDADGDPIRDRHEVRGFADNYWYAGNDEYGALYRLDGNVAQLVDLGEDVYARSLDRVPDTLLVVVSNWLRRDEVWVVELTDAGPRRYEPASSVTQRREINFWAAGNAFLLSAYDGNDWHFYRKGGDKIVPFKWPDKPMFAMAGVTAVGELFIVCMRPGTPETSALPCIVDDKGNVTVAIDAYGRQIAAQDMVVVADAKGIYIVCGDGRSTGAWYRAAG